MFKAVRVPLFFALLCLSGCFATKGVKETTLGSTQTSQAISTARIETNQAVSGQTVIIDQAASALPESRNKEVILNASTDIKRIVGQPSYETETQFEKLAKQLLSVNLSEQVKGNAERGRIVGENAELTARISKLEETYRQQLATERANAEAAIKQAQIAGEERVKRVIAIGGASLGAILILAALGMVYFAAQIPFLGPRAALFTGCAGAVVIAGSIGYVQLLNHPNVIWWALGIAAALLTGAIGLMYSNQIHHKENVGNPL